MFRPVPKTPPKFLSTAQVAQAKGVSVRTVVRWVDSGRLTPVVKMPGETGAYVFDPADVEAMAS